MQKILLFLLLSFSLFSTPPKVVVFDYGGVVANIDRGPLLHFISSSLDVPYKKVKRDFSSDALYTALQKPATFWKNYAKHPIPKEWYRAFEEEKARVVQDIPGVRGIITQLKKQGIQVIVLSNTQPERARFIEQLGGYDLFDLILLSCHLGVEKPNPKIYEKLLEYIPHNPQECLFIDNRKRNVRAGKKKGLDGIVFISTEQLKQDLAKREIFLQ